ncbi:MAG: glycosidase [Candidatus Oleimicrobiaceae bacterium]
MKDVADFGQFSELFRRHPRNPILTASDWPYPANAVFNPGAVQYDGATLLLVRVEDMRGFSHLTVARSADGVTDWQIDPQPTFAPDPAHHPEELWGVEDPRIVWLEELERFAVTYTAFSERGPLVSLAMTKDFRTFARRGPIMPPEDKDSSLFPRRFKGRWVLIHRPIPVTPGAGAHIWVSYSPDLTHWGDHTILLEARQGGWWDARKIGLNTPPIETPEGWLIIYHGVRTTAAGAIYRLGLALLDLDEPTRVIARSDTWVFGPRELYERVGDVADVVFPCGAILDPASRQLRLYYGAADTTVALATAQVDDLLAHLQGKK